MAESYRSSEATPAWLRVVLPSMADIIFVALLGALVLTPLSVRLLGDAGIGWHIRTGQQILTTLRVPRVDPFSSEAPCISAERPDTAAEHSTAERCSRKWLAWEWLYDVVVGELEATLGLNGVVWLTAVVIAAVFAWTFRLLIRGGTNLLAALVLVLLAISASMIHFLARPHVVSWLFTLAWFAILDRSEKAFDRSRVLHLLWTLPLLMLVWVNVHGGFLFGFALLAVFWLGAVWDWFRARSDRIEESFAKITAGQRARDLFLAGLLLALASLVNPYGWKLHAHVYSYLTNHFLMDHIDEFQSPNFHLIAQKCFLALLLIAFSVVAARSGTLRMSHVLTLLLAVYAGLYASRNIPVASILVVLLIGPLISSGKLWRGARSSESPGFLQRMAAVESEVRGHLWPILAIAATLAVALNGGRVGSSQIMNAHFDPKRMPVAAVDFLEQQHVTGSVLSPDFWGGYLIYRHIPVVVDDRHDMYGEDFFNSYLKMVHVENGWQKFLEAQPASCVLLPRDAALANVLAQTAGWKSIYSDDVAMAFVRDAPAKPAR